MPKLVYSRTLEHADWNATIVCDVVPEDVNRLEQQPGGDMVLGDADLTREFLRHDLIDEIRLYVHPVIRRWQTAGPAPASSSVSYG